MEEASVLCDAAPSRRRRREDPDVQRALLRTPARRPDAAAGGGDTPARAPPGAEGDTSAAPPGGLLAAGGPLPEAAGAAEPAAAAPAGPAPGALVEGGAVEPELPSEVNHESAEWRRAYKVLWTRVYRKLQLLKAKGERSELETAFVEAPGHLLCNARLTVLRLLDPHLPLETLEVMDKLATGVVLPCGRRKRASSRIPHFFAGNTGLFTWNGDFGVEEALFPPGSSVEVAVAALQASVWFTTLLAEWHSWWEGILSAYCANAKWVYAWELSTTSLDSGKCRLHVHLAVMSLMGGQPIKILEAEHWSFKGSPPYLGAPVSERTKSRGRNFQHFFYLQVKKTGQVYTRSNVEMFVDYQVNPEWCFNLLQQRKISIDTARSAIIQTAKNVPRQLANLQGYEQALSRMRQEAELEEVRRELKADACPFVSLPAVNEWLETFHKKKYRYQFLVLEGPSMVGKTAYAESLSPGSALFHCDCASAIEPDLREYSADRSDSILFDEASVELVLRCKRLFQAPPVEVCLGMSATNCNAYKVNVYRKRLIIASNRWTAELDAAKKCDADWIIDNSVHIRVQRPLWVQPASQATPP